MNFHLVVNCSNAAFSDEEQKFNFLELAELLRDVAKNVGDGRSGGPILDVNGNRVGRFELY
jgi:hypothetical protein